MPTVSRPRRFGADEVPLRCHAPDIIENAPIFITTYIFKKFGTGFQTSCITSKITLVASIIIIHQDKEL